jgi:hypothetical protein
VTAAQTGSSSIGKEDQQVGRSREALSGRFWVLDEASADEEEPLPDSPRCRRERYVCNSIDSNGDSSISARQARREHKRNLQRWVARELAISPRASPVLSSGGHPRSSSSERKLPVLSPSTFFLDNFDTNEWIAVTRRERKRRVEGGGRRFPARRWPSPTKVYSRRRNSDSKRFEKGIISGHKAHNNSVIFKAGQKNHKD